MFDKSGPQSDDLQSPRQEGAGPIITINEPDKVSPLGFYSHIASEDADGLLHLSLIQRLLQV